MPKITLIAAQAQRADATKAMGFKKKPVATLKELTVAQRAKHLAGVVAKVKTPIALNPAHPIQGESFITIFGPLMVTPEWPAGTGNAGYNPMFSVGATFPGVQVAFPRIQKGKLHLVEFHVQLNMSIKYKFRVFEYPLGDYADIELQGPKSDIIIALVPPVDEISGDLELGAAVQQRNSESQAAGWNFYQVKISTV